MMMWLLRQIALSVLPLAVFLSYMCLINAFLQIDARIFGQVYVVVYFYCISLFFYGVRLLWILVVLLLLYFPSVFVVYFDFIKEWESFHY